MLEDTITVTTNPDLPTRDILVNLEVNRVVGDGTKTLVELDGIFGDLVRWDREHLLSIDRGWSTC